MQAADTEHAKPPSSVLAAVTATLPSSLRGMVKSARELARAAHDAPPHRYLATLIPELDELLGGGLPCGDMVELVGRRSSGRFTIVLAALAAATQAGEISALVDLGDHLDPQRAGADGVELDRLLWLRPQRSKAALAAAEMLITCGFPLVVIDLGTPPIPGGRGQTGSWIRLLRAASEYRTALLLSTPYVVSGAAATFRIEVENEATHWLGHGRTPRLLSTCATRLHLRRARHRPAPGAKRGERRLVWSVPVSIARGGSD